MAVALAGAFTAGFGCPTFTVYLSCVDGQGMPSTVEGDARVPCASIPRICPIVPGQALDAGAGKINRLGERHTGRFDRIGTGFIIQSKHIVSGKGNGMERKVIGRVDGTIGFSISLREANLIASVKGNQVGAQIIPQPDNLSIVSDVIHPGLDRRTLIGPGSITSASGGKDQGAVLSGNKLAYRCARSIRHAA